MSEKEVGSPERHLDDFHNKFTSGLRHRRCTQPSSIPFPCPPCAVGFVVLVLSSQEYGNQDFLKSPLNCDDGDDAQDCVGCVPKLKEPLSIHSRK